MAKSRSKKGISHGRSPAAPRKDNLSSVWVAKKGIGRCSKGPHDWSTAGLWAHKLADVSLFLALGVGWHTFPMSQQGCHCWVLFPMEPTSCSMEERLCHIMSMPGGMGLGASWSSGRCFCPWQESWNEMIFKIPSYPNHFVFCDHGGLWGIRAAGQSQVPQGAMLLIECPLK